jgi:hypothetical protein
MALGDHEPDPFCRGCGGRGWYSVTVVANSPDGESVPTEGRELCPCTDRDEEQRGSRCGPGCGYCGACS